MTLWISVLVGACICRLILSLCMPARAPPAGFSQWIMENAGLRASALHCLLRMKNYRHCAAVVGRKERWQQWERERESPAYYVHFENPHGLVDNTMQYLNCIEAWERETNRLIHEHGIKWLPTIHFTLGVVGPSPLWETWPSRVLLMWLAL